VYYFGRKVGYLLAWALELQPLGAVVILGSPESSRVLEPLDSEEVFLAQFAREHFRLATVSVQVNPLASVFRPALSENRQAFRKASALAKHQALRKVSLQAGLVERTYFLQPLHLAKHLAHLTILPEHFCLAIVSVQVGPMSPVLRPALSENRQAFRKVWLPAGLVERASFLQPLHLAKHPEQHSPSANSRQVSINWAVFSAQQPQSESRSRRAIWLRLEVR
jgi:hypothetical protein